VFSVTYIEENIYCFTYCTVGTTVNLRSVNSKWSYSLLGNRVIDSWNWLSADCVHCKTTNTFKKHLSPALESGAV